MLECLDLRFTNSIQEYIHEFCSGSILHKVSTLHIFDIFSRVMGTVRSYELINTLTYQLALCIAGYGLRTVSGEPIQ